MLPAEIVQKIKAFVPRDSERSSPTAVCIRALLQDYIDSEQITQDDIDENDGDWMCLTIRHFRESYFARIQADRLFTTWFGFPYRTHYRSFTSSY